MFSYFSGFCIKLLPLGTVTYWTARCAVVFVVVSSWDKETWGVSIGWAKLSEALTMSCVLAASCAAVLQRTTDV